jgi:hypothetical protein
MVHVCVPSVMAIDPVGEVLAPDAVGTTFADTV